MDIVHHIEFVLNEIRIWIDGLVLITRQLLVGEILGCNVVVITCFPGWFVTAGASPTHEEFLALLYLLVFAELGNLGEDIIACFHHVAMA